MLFLDFEFNGVKDPNVNLVCCTTFNLQGDPAVWVKKMANLSPELIDAEIEKLKFDGSIREWWLHNDPLNQADLAHYLEHFRKEDVIIFGYAAVAEARSFLALGLNPVLWKWIDGFIEYRMLTNHNDNLLYGPQLVDGKVKVTRKPPPKWERTEEDSLSSFKPTHSLAECTFKLTGQIRDTEHKDKMRDLIISSPDEFTPQERVEIQDYCTEDVIFLPMIYVRIKEEYKNLDFLYDTKFENEMLLRGKYSALTAKMESAGYPIDYDKTRNFSSAVAPILDETQREINALFPDIKPFKWNKKENRFSWDQKVTKQWLKDNADIPRWTKTDGYKTAKRNVVKDLTAKIAKEQGRKVTATEKEKAMDNLDPADFLSLSLEAWTKQYDYKHDYPKDSFPAQMVRYLKLKQNLNGFVPNARGSFWDAVGPDDRVRPYMNPFGSLSGRSQPGSRSFLFLKPAWMRSLCVPKPGRAICSVDYGSQEYLISALIAEDDAMVESYFSSDVYLSFAIASGMAPANATKETHKKERQLAKAAVLGMSYLMTAIGLSAKLSADTGALVTEDDAQDLIDAFYEVYYDLGKWQEDIQKQYLKEKHLKLPCGWTLFGDSDNFRSFVNFNIQGLGGSIMRKAVELCDEAGLQVIITLHDALYIEFDENDLGAVDKLLDCMRRAFQFYFPENQKEIAGKIKMDPFIWGPGFDDPIISYYKDDKGRDVKKKTYHSVTTPNGLEVDVSKVYVDERSDAEYEQFSKYFEDRAENYL